MTVGINKRNKKRGMAMIAFAVMSIALVPIVGLSIDVGVLYTIKTKLSEAVDAGALAGARSLSQGSDLATQTTNAQTTAKDYVRANFPTGFFETTNLSIPDPTVDTSVGNTRSVVVTASVEAPLYFLHWFTSNRVPVNASATAVRRDVNVVMVVDRSGSLQTSGSCGAVRAAATAFADKFAEGRDNVGLITFASSAFPDFPIAGDFKTASPNVATLLSGLVCNGYTSSAMALWQGYQQLATLNQPNALNVILFFTDGQPTGVTANYPILPGSSCVDHNPKFGVFSIGGGLIKASVGAQPLASDLVVAPNSAGCAYSRSWSGSMSAAANDVSSIPAQDFYGNRTETGYQPVPRHRNGGIDPSDSSSVTAATINAADDAGLRIRHGAAPGGALPSVPNVTIFSIGLGTNGIAGADAFLQRVSNDPAASNYESTYSTGSYIVAPTAADLSDAFNKIASEILRLAK